MAIERPTLLEIQEIFEAELASEFGLTSPLPPQTIIKLLAAIWAGNSHLVYGFIIETSKEIIPDTATTEYLERWGEVWGITRKDAAAAQGQTKFTGTNGVTIPLGTTINRQDGIQYTTDAAVIIALGEAVADITCTEAGTIGNMDADTQLSLDSAITGVDTVSYVVENVNSGTEIETDEALRARLLDRIALPPQGGNANDYQEWALSVSGVTRAWVKENTPNVGKVTVYFVLDGNASIFPDASKEAEVQTYIDSVRPLTIETFCYGPDELSVDFTVQISPNTSAIQSKVQAEIEDFIGREMEPGKVLDIDALSFQLNYVRGLDNHIITTPITNVLPAAFELITLGTVTYESV